MAKILLVEDNELNRDMLTRRLERRGFEVVSGQDGQQGLQLAETQTPNIILLDMTLPVLSGWDVARRLKSSPATRLVPVIGLSAHSAPGDRERAMQAGCDDYDTKPIDLPRLLAKVAALLQRG